MHDSCLAARRQRTKSSTWSGPRRGRCPVVTRSAVRPSTCVTPPHDGRRHAAQSRRRRCRAPSAHTVPVSSRGWLILVETPELAALVPDLMAQYPHFAWRLTSGRVEDEALGLELHPRARPERLARIEVNPHGEVYFLSFGGHDVSPDFAYEDEDKHEVLEDLIKNAVALATGPTRITRRVVEGLEVSSSLEIDPDSANPRSFGVSFSPMTYVKARLRGSLATKESSTFPLSRTTRSGATRPPAPQTVGEGGASLRHQPPPPAAAASCG